MNWNHSLLGLGLLMLPLALCACRANVVVTAAPEAPAWTEAVPVAPSATDAGVPREGGSQPSVTQSLAKAAARPEAGPVADVAAAAYVVMDGDTGALLAQFNAHERRPPASLTKIMTALLVLERGKLDDVATVNEAILSLQVSTLMGIAPGEQLTVRNLLYGLMLPSGNDAAITLSQRIAGTEYQFVQMMNRRAGEIGLWNTHFANSHGLDSRFGDHYTSAYDLAVLTQTAMRNPLFRDLVSTKYAEFGGALNYYSMGNGNDLLWNYPGADGVKIGYTRGAQQTVVGSAVRDGRRVIAVALGSTQRTLDAHRLLNAGFQSLAR